MEMTPEALSWLLDGTIEYEVESGTITAEQGQDVVVTPALQEAVEVYEDSLHAVLGTAVVDYGLVSPQDSDRWLEHFYGVQDDASLDALMTLRGEGVGHWDGRWDAHFTPEQIEDLNVRFKRDLSVYADDSGSGSVNDAMMEAVIAVGAPSFQANEYDPSLRSAASAMQRSLRRIASAASMGLRALEKAPEEAEQGLRKAINDIEIHTEKAKSKLAGTVGTRQRRTSQRRKRLRRTS